MRIMSKPKMIDEMKGALAEFASHHPNLNLSWAAWRTAFVGGSLFAEEARAYDCVCEGQGHILTQNHGAVKCYGCQPVIHMARFDDVSGPLCEAVTGKPVTCEEDYGSVTCPYCLHVILGDSEKCTGCGEECSPLCNDCQ